MSRFTIVFTACLILVFIGWIYISGGFNPPKDYRAPTTTDANPDQQSLKIIVAKRQFSNGKHVITGEVQLPNPCQSLQVETVVTKSTPEQVALNFSSSSTAESCAQQVTSVPFRQEFEASGYAVIRAFWNGEPARLQFIN